ncbi:hypothetical protein E2542_SST19886 [Spatholobus suberectus]|nr:hypothetical protein E2542_SST19886 [Spatholobus suberectus]
MPVRHSAHLECSNGNSLLQPLCTSDVARLGLNSGQLMVQLFTIWLGDLLSGNYDL